MAKKSTFGSSVVFNSEIHFKGQKTEVRGAGKLCIPVGQNEIAAPVNANAFVPMILGGIPAMAAGQSMSIWEQRMLGGITAASMIEVSKNPSSAKWMLNYALSLLKVTDGAYAKNGNLNENELKQLIASIISQMLQNADPGYADWKQILADAMQQETINGFLKGIQPVICALTGDPVNANTGNFIYDKEDIHLNGTPFLAFKRVYNRIDKRVGCMGVGWRHNYEIELLIEEDRYVILWGDGREEIYMRANDSTEPLFGCLSRLKCFGEQFIYQTQDGICYTFDAKGHLLSQLNSNGAGIHLSYNRQGKLISVFSGNGASLSYHYDSISGYLFSVQDHTGRKITFTYDLGRLCKVMSAMGESYSYYYDDNGALYKIRNPRNVVVLENRYDKKGRTIKQVFADGGEIYYDYQEEDSRTLVTQQDDSKVAYYHDERFRNVKTVYVDGEEQFFYNDRNLLTQWVDKNGNKIKFVYDDRGNRTQVIYPDGSKHNMTYDAGNRLLEMSINGIPKVKNTYDTKGNIQKTEDALGRSKVFRYNADEKVTEIIQADRSSVYLEYDTRGNITKVTDAHGNTTSYSYDELNRIIKTLDGNGNPTSYQYDTYGQIKKVTNSEGKTRIYEYTKNGKLSRVVDFNGAVTSQIYNSMNQIETVTLPDGGKQKLEYDLMQNISRQFAPNGAETKYQYDLLNRLQQITLTNGGTISYEYDPNGNRTGITDSNGNHTCIEYDERNRIIIVTDPAGARTEYEYDLDGNVATIMDPLGRATTYTYNAAGQKTKEADSTGNYFTYEYNELGNVSCVTDSQNHKKILEYNPGGTLAKTIYQDGSFEQYLYDKNNNLICRKNNKGDYLEISYDCLNRMVHVVSSYGQEKSFTYDTVGNVTSVTDALGNVTFFTYSLGGKLTSVLDAEGNRTEYAYDAMGDLIIICQHEGDKQLLLGGRPVDLAKVHITQYQRNLLGKVEKITNPLGFTEEYCYDLAGQLLNKRDQEGFQTHYTYTPVGEIETITYADGRSVALTYNPLRQLTEIKDWLGVTKIEMDDMIRTKKITDYKGREIAYHWNQAGKREAIVYPDGRTVSYEYDEESRLSRLADGERDIKYYYDEDGRLSEKILPDGIHGHYSYNQMGFLSSLSYENTEGILEKYSYLYDKIGNKTEIQRNRNAGESTPLEFHTKIQEENGIYQYQYDRLNRLTEVSKNRKVVRRYKYDSFGNRIGLETEIKKERYSFNAANQLVRTEGIYPEESYRYDARGNLTEIFCGDKLINKYVYDETNRLSKAVNGKGESATYQYDGLGNRTGVQEYVFDSKILSTQVVTQLDPFFENPIREIDYLLDRTQAYHNLIEKIEITEEQRQSQTYVCDQEITFMLEGDTAYIYLKDELGSPIRLLGVGKNQHTIFGYDEFGQDLYGNQGERQPFGYAGYRKDRIAGTYFAQAREYLEKRGIFTSKDIDIFMRKESPVTINQYLYCKANPLKYIDLLGFDSYVFYDPQNFEKQANSEARRLERYYKKNVVRIPISNREEFEEQWNAIKDDNIDEISLAFHGQPYALIINENINSVLTTNASGITNSGTVATSIQSLDQIGAIPFLNILSCNTGHLSHENNVASIFLTSQNITEVHSWDGSTVYNKMLGFRDHGFGEYIPTLANSQEYFESWLNDGEERNPIGKVIYYFDENGKLSVRSGYLGDQIKLNYPLGCKSQK